MKNLIIASIALFCLCLAACGVSKDAEIKSFSADVDRLTKEITEKVNADPTINGVDAAQKLLDGKKADLKAKFGDLEKARGFQVSQDVSKKFVDDIANNMMAINELKINHLDKASEDEAFGKKLDKLVGDFNALFGV